MNSPRFSAAVAFFSLLAVGLYAAGPLVEVARIEAEARRSSETLKTSWLTLDRNGDGKIDHRVQLDEKGNKLYEEVDFNFDGHNDDFCFYSRGVLIREEIDTNFDQRIDLWIFLHRGVYVERYEKDTDFDGVPDLVKRFGK